MKTEFKLLFGVLIALAVIFGVYTYFNGSSGNGVQEPSASDNGEEFTIQSKTITIGTIGDDAVEEIKNFQPTADYIAEKLSDSTVKYKGNVVIAKDIDDAAKLLRENKLDLYIDSPFTATEVSKKSGAELFLRRWKSGVAEYHSVFFVKKDSSIRNVSGFAGMTIVSEDESSTAGYLLPKVHMIQNRLNTNDSSKAGYVKFIFSGDDTNTPIWVAEGKADIGAMNNVDFGKLSEIVKGGLRIVGETADVPRHVVAHSAGMGAADAERIKQILEGMDKDAEGVKILAAFEGTTKYDNLPKDVILRIESMVGMLD